MKTVNVLCTSFSWKCPYCDNYNAEYHITKRLKCHTCKKMVVSHVTHILYPEKERREREERSKKLERELAKRAAKESHIIADRFRWKCRHCGHIQSLKKLPASFESNCVKCKRTSKMGSPRLFVDGDTINERFQVVERERQGKNV